MCVACFPPLLSPLFLFSWELVAPGSSSIIWGEASVLTDARTHCMGGSNFYAVVFTDYSSQVWGGDCFFAGLLSWESCGLTKSLAVMPPRRSVRKVSWSPCSCELLEKKLRSEPCACLSGSCLPVFCPHPNKFQKSHTKFLKWFCKTSSAWGIWYIILVAQDYPRFLPHFSWRENTSHKAFVVQRRKMLTPVLGYKLIRNLLKSSVWPETAKPSLYSALKSILPSNAFHCNIAVHSNQYSGAQILSFLNAKPYYTSFSRLHANENYLQPSLSERSPRVALPNSWLVGCTARGTL